MQFQVNETTRQSSCETPQEAYHLWRNLSNHNLSRWGGEGTPSCLGRGVPHPVLVGGSTPFCLGGGTPSWPGQGGTHHLGLGYIPPVTGVPHQALGYLCLGLGYPSPGTGIPATQKNTEPVEVLWDGDEYPQKGHGTCGSMMGWRWGYPPAQWWTKGKHYTPPSFGCRR